MLLYKVTQFFDQFKLDKLVLEVIVIFNQFLILSEKLLYEVTPTKSEKRIRQILLEGETCLSSFPLNGDASNRP